MDPTHGDGRSSNTDLHMEIVDQVTHIFTEPIHKPSHQQILIQMETDPWALTNCTPILDFKTSIIWNSTFTS